MTCEWNPDKKRLSFNDEVNAIATWCVGHNGKFHLCDDCVNLPKFKKYKVKEKLIKIKLEEINK